VRLLAEGETAVFRAPTEISPSTGAQSKAKQTDLFAAASKDL